MAYRGAALYLTDAERVRVRALLTKAYTARSKYAHGDETAETDIDLHALRDTALTLYLRWLVLHAQAHEHDVPALLDLSVLDGAVRGRRLHTPLLAFHEATAPFKRPPDVFAGAATANTDTARPATRETTAAADQGT